MAEVAKDVLVSFSNLTIRVSADKVLHYPGAFSIKSDGLCKIIGPNGAGKTVLIDALVGLRKIEGGSLNRRKCLRVLYSTQFNFFVPGLNIYQNIVLTARLDPTIDLKKEVFKYAKRYLISDYLTGYPADLSGGELQKTAIIRALISGAELVIFDEPFNHLDINSIELATEDILKLSKSVSIIIVDHSNSIKISDKHGEFQEISYG